MWAMNFRSAIPSVESTTRPNGASHMVCAAGGGHCSVIGFAGELSAMGTELVSTAIQFRAYNTKEKKR